MTPQLLSLKKEISRKKLDAILISSVANIIYLTNFSYFSHYEREAFLLVLKNKQYILTDGRYAEAIKENTQNFDLIEISSSLTFEKTLKNLAKKHRIKYLGVEENNLTAKEHKKLSRLLNDLSHFTVADLRMIKNPSEISAIEEACRLGDKTFEHVITLINRGVTERQLGFEIEFFIKKHGADISFPPIVAFGKNSAIPHHKSSDKRLTTKDKIVLLDFGAKVNNYCSDMTRTVFFGKPTRKQKRIYETVLEAQQKAIEYLKSLIINHKSIAAKEVDKVARNYIISKNYNTIPHSVGHGIGLEVHEKPIISPKSKDILKAGMVFSIEPGIYIPGFGGVRIEDLVVLENFSPRLLTHSSKDIIQL
ncbi:MAG: aminopeptidase P family protein [Candidatus Levybacteria bacterium]|nr:aminopeptidase P family protein [Candidatus Levybacteria bacterium]